MLLLLLLLILVPAPDAILGHFPPDGQMQQETLPQRSAIFRLQQLVGGGEGEEEPREDEKEVRFDDQDAFERTIVVEVLDDGRLVGR